MNQNSTTSVRSIVNRPQAKRRLSETILAVLIIGIGILLIQEPFFDIIFRNIGYGHLPAYKVSLFVTFYWVLSGTLLIISAIGLLMMKQWWSYLFIFASIIFLPEFILIGIRIFWEISGWVNWGVIEY